jgi:threonine dehydrogenase-like Zn-dependent dehydrogenase
MKTVICKNKHLSFVDRPEPVPENGQVLVRVLRCGICGSDLHARAHCDHLADMAARSGYPSLMRSHQEVVMGHEFSAEILAHGPGCNRKVKTGTLIVAPPIMRQGQSIHPIGLSELAPGAYAEYMLLDETMIMPVPNGLGPDLAALTEPMAVAWHAIRRGELGKGDVAVVIGCGPVGLAIICLLKARGVKCILASDFSAGRRALARRCGADVVINPAQESLDASWDDYGFVRDLPGVMELAVGTREKLGTLPLPWWHVWRAAEILGLSPKRPVIFECVGAPGILQHIIAGAPMFSRVVVVGVCMQADLIEPALAINKEIDLRFVLGYSPLEFRDVLHMIAEGKVDCMPLITGIIGLEGVDAAFTALGDPDQHAKILIDPSSHYTTPVPMSEIR